MPRPTIAQVVCGFLTVVLSTLAMLLLSGARSGAGVVGIAAAGLILGLLVALAVALKDRRVPGVPAAGTAAVPSPAPAPAHAPRPVSVPRSRVAGGTAEARVGEHSLRR
jgi:hypothetical protein